MKKLLLLCVVLLSSCRLYTIDDYKMEMMGKYYGANAGQLVVDYGIPTNAYTYGDMTLIEFYREENEYIPKSYTVKKDNYNSKNSPYSDTTVTISEEGGYSVNHNCKTTFYLRNGKVFDLRFDGNDCFHSYFVWD